MASGSSFFLFFVNPRTRQPTVCGWIVSLLFMSVLINILLSKVSRHNTEEKDQVVSLPEVNPKYRHNSEEKDRVVSLDEVNPKFRNFPTHIPSKQRKKIGILRDDNINEKKVGILPDDDTNDKEEDRQPIPFPVFHHKGTMPVFDPNAQLRKKQALNKEWKKESESRAQVAGAQVAGAQVGEHQKPQPKQFPVDVLLRPDISCDQEPSLLMVIFSRPENRGGRSAIRSTWARYSADKYPSAQIRWISIFVIGRARTDWLEEEIKAEYGKHRDILQGDFIDSPYEDTRKFMLALKWMMGSAQLTNECKVHYVLKSMDNIFLNMNAISGWLNVKFSRDDTLYIGRLLRKDAPIRDLDNPLQVSLGDYPKQFFPDLIQGPVYLFSYDALTQMNKVMEKVTPIAMEDAYIGLLAEKRGITPRHNDHFQMVSHIRDGCHFLKMFFIYNILPNDHLVIDRNIEDAKQNKKCGAVAKAYNHVET